MFRIVFITMPRTQPRNRPNKLPVRRHFKTSKRIYDGNWQKKKTDIGPDKHRPKTRRIRLRHLLRPSLVAANKSK